MQTAPFIDLSTIPAAQRAAVLALMEAVAALTELTRRQEHLLAELNHALQGKRSEKLLWLPPVVQEPSSLLRM